MDELAKEAKNELRVEGFLQAPERDERLQPFLKP